MLWSTLSGTPEEALDLYHVPSGSHQKDTAHLPQFGCRRTSLHLPRAQVFPGWTNRFLKRSAFSATNRRGYRSLAGMSPGHPGSLIQADFGYGAGMDVVFECQDCGIFRSGRVA